MPEKQKLTVNLSPQLVQVLRELADKHGNTLTEELKKAIEDRKFFSDKVEAGNEVQLYNGANPNQKTIVDLRLN
jgi:predicted transcriptional regulator